MEKMKAFPHAVIYNGTFYPANTPMKAAEEGKRLWKRKILLQGLQNP